MAISSVKIKMDVLGERTRGRERDPGSVNSMNDEADSGGNGLKVEHLRCVQQQLSISLWHV